MKVADYEEEECVRLAFLLHKGTMEENYSLEKLIAECGEREEKDMEKPVRKTMIDELLEEKESGHLITIRKNMTGLRNRRWEARSCVRQIICGSR